MSKSDNMRELEYLASSQWGMFTTAQAAALGVGRTQISRLAGHSTVEAVRRGTYRHVIGEETSHPFAKAAWLSCYPKLTAEERLRRRPHDAVIACATAASLHGMGDYHEDPYTLIVRRRRQTSPSTSGGSTSTTSLTSTCFPSPPWSARSKTSCGCVITPTTS